MDGVRAQLSRSVRHVARSVACATALATSGCGSAPDARAAAPEANAAFFAPLPVVHSLAHGAPSAEAALRAVVRAASTHDTAMLVRLAVTRAEWGRLYYPTSRFARPPYRSPAALQWGLTVAASDKGVRRLLRELGGRDVTVRDVRCGPPRDEGANQLWLGCEVTYRVGARDATRSITGALIARDGRVKVLSYANDF